MRARSMTCLSLALGLLFLGAGTAHSTDRRPTILLSSSDGIESEGLAALYDALAPDATVIVAAPQADQSGSSHMLTHRVPILVTPIKRPDGGRWYAIRATPATCVRVALKALLDDPPDLVITGINSTFTLATMVWTSSTLAAARDAALWGIPAIAISRTGRDPADLRATAAFVRRLVRELRERELLRPGLLLNVNAPRGIASGLKGVRVTRQTTLAPHQAYERRIAPSGQLYFWDIWKQVEADAADTDVGAHGQGYLTITPLSLDQTDRALLDPLRRELEF